MQRVLVPVVIGLMTCPTVVRSEDRGVMTDCRPVGTVRVTTAKGLDVRAKKALDAMAPKLRTVGKDRLLRIEGHDGTDRNAEESLSNSLMLAKNVQIYLASRHTIDLDVYLATAADSDKGRTVRIYVCPKQFVEENLDLPRNITDSKRDFDSSVSAK